jgi:hypothetical protein
MGEQPLRKTGLHMRAAHQNTIFYQLSPPLRASSALFRRFLTTSVAALLLLSVVAGADVVVTTNSSPSEIAFDSLISPTDLLNLGQASLAAGTNTVPPNAGFTLDGIHDGLTASYANDPSGAFARNTYYSAAETTMTFFLNTNAASGGSPSGYEISGVNVFSGWKDVDNFQGQKWTLRVATLAHPDFSDIQSIAYRPPTGAKSAMVSITNTTSTLVSGATAVQFIIQKLSSSGVVFREIDVTGVPSPPSVPPPAPTALTAMGSSGLSNALVTLFWTDAPGATGYHVWRSQLSGTGYTIVGSSTAPAYTDTTVTNGKTYYYIITATNVAGDSAHISPAIATTSAQAAAPLRILCIGDGTTSGYTDNPDWRIPFQFGFRSGLYLRMITNGHPIQFVGDSPEPWNGTFGLPTNTPAPDLRVLDQDHHRGYAGANTGFVISHLHDWLALDNPDVILMLVGLDDSDMPEARSNLTNIVRMIDTARPHARTIFAQVTPTIYYSQFIVDYNAFLRDTLIPAFRAEGKHVSTVDQYSHLLSAGEIDPSLFSNGLNHPDNKTYDRMAQTWYVGIQAALTSSSSVTFTSIASSGGNLILAGSGGAPNARFAVLSSTNASFSQSSWQTNSQMGTFDSSGSFRYTVPLTPNVPAVFFRIQPE